MTMAHELWVIRYEVWLCVRFYLNHLNKHWIQQLHTANNCKIRYGTKFSNIINVLSKYQCISQKKKERKKLCALQHSCALCTEQIQIGPWITMYLHSLRILLWTHTNTHTLSHQMRNNKSKKKKSISKPEL